MYINSTRSVPFPELNLSDEELRKVVIKQFTPTSSQFEFEPFLRNNLKNYIVKYEIGLKIPSNVVYTDTSLHVIDQIRVREIIWDLIIDRYLTIGGGNRHEWPHFTITAKGDEFFASQNS